VSSALPEKHAVNEEKQLCTGRRFFSFFSLDEQRKENNGKEKNRKNL
jgi:hypothetical protein